MGYIVTLFARAISFFDAFHLQAWLVSFRPQEHFGRILSLGDWFSGDSLVQDCFVLNMAG